MITFLRARAMVLWWSLAAIGAATHLGGLAWDLYLHGNDPGLAAREGIFTLSNPGHALIVVGVTVTVTGLSGALVSWLLSGDHGRFARAIAYGSIPAALAVAVGTAWMASRAETQDHEHLVHAAEASHDEASEVVAPANAAAQHGHGTGTFRASQADAAAGPMSEANAHTHGSEVAVTPDHLLAAATFYGKVKEAITPYEDIRVAMAAGYMQTTQDLEGIAAHFTHAVHSRDGRLMDPAKPETLLYSKRFDGTWRLMGAMFTSEQVAAEPPAFFGPLDAWHRHENLCFVTAAVTVTKDAASCRGVFVPVTPWMLHVWTAPGATSGAFAHDFPPITPGAFPGATLPAARELTVAAGGSR